jgi:hypothetical protein
MRRRSEIMATAVDAVNATNVFGDCVAVWVGGIDGVRALDTPWALEWRCSFTVQCFSPV